MNSLSIGKNRTYCNRAVGIHRIREWSFYRSWAPNQPSAKYHKRNSEETIRQSKSILRNDARDHHRRKKWIRQKRM